MAVHDKSEEYCYPTKCPECGKDVSVVCTTEAFIGLSHWVIRGRITRASVLRFALGVSN